MHSSGYASISDYNATVFVAPKTYRICAKKPANYRLLYFIRWVQYELRHDLIPLFHFLRYLLICELNCDLLLQKY